MVDFLLWFILITILGWLAFPIANQFFKQSYDRGYTVSKVIGLLIWGFIFWIGNISGLLANNQVGTIGALILLLIISFLCARQQGISSITTWIKGNKSMVIFHETVFLAAFLIWTIVRGANPEITGTEKPMELAFINGIFQSPSFPPNDPWLSGYSISYYYFGYLIVAAFMHLLGTASGVAFNLAISLTFALVAATSSGILINLLVQKEMDIKSLISRKRLKQILLISLLAPMLILIVSNAEGFLEMLHSKGVFWEEQTDHQLNSGFWQWLDIQDLSQTPPLPLDWKPSRMGGTWWWRASRVLQDYTAAGQTREIIDEFPFFSYLLADLHPHVLAMPFVLVAIYCGFYVLRFTAASSNGKNGVRDYLKSPNIWFLAFTTGSLLFLNTWDFPIYFGIIFMAFVYSDITHSGWHKENIWKYLSFGIAFGLACIFIYFPFLISLSSQAGGLLPSLIYRTRAVHFLVMFFPQISVLSVFLLGKALTQRKPSQLMKILGIGSIVLVILFLFSLAIPAFSQLALQILSVLGSSSGADMASKNQNILSANQSFLSVYGADDAGELIVLSLRKLIQYPILVLGLLFAVSIILFLLVKKSDEKAVETEKSPTNIHISDQYVLILVLMGTLLALIPEFFYLRDQFGWRMNTIFKFYFQVWILWSLGAAYAVANIVYVKSSWKKYILSVGSILVIGVGLIYPAFAIFDKTNSFKNIEWSLDGNLYYELTNPTDMEAIQYLSTLPYGVVTEAVGGSYSSYGRVSKISGYPTVLGWPGHELQWRGGGEEIGSRESDIKQLYEADDWDTARHILNMYDIRYVFISSLERSTYQVRESKFANNLTLIFSNQDAVIYLVPGIE